MLEGFDISTCKVRFFKSVWTILYSALILMPLVAQIKCRRELNQGLPLFLTCMTSDGLWQSPPDVISGYIASRISTKSTWSYPLWKMTTGSSVHSKTECSVCWSVFSKPTNMPKTAKCRLCIWLHKLSISICPLDNRETGSLWWETVHLTTKLQLILKYHLPNKNPTARLSANIAHLDTEKLTCYTKWSKS